MIPPEMIFLFAIIIIIAFGAHFFLENKKKTKNSCEQKYFSQKGTAVRSKAEQRIANFLEDQKIEYEYEKAIHYKKWTIYCDFYLVQYGIYIEYYGMLGEKKYNEKICWKKEVYKGKKIIELYPNNWQNIEWILKKRFEKVTHSAFPQRKFIPYKAY